MNIIEAFQQELEFEARITRRFLSIVPHDHYSWKPHSRSMTLQQLITHIAEIPGWVKMVLETPELDFSKTPYSPAIIENNESLLDYFETCLEEAKTALMQAKMEQLSEPWALRNAEVVYVACSKQEMLRSVFSQVVHHRAQLGVFLRLLDIPIPGTYGPSADEHEG